jgi:hypothetical protein
MGDVIGDLNSRRGKVGSMEQRGHNHVISAEVPLSEMFGYATDVRSRPKDVPRTPCSLRATSKRRGTSKKRSSPRHRAVSTSHIPK